MIHFSLKTKLKTNTSECSTFRTKDYYRCPQDPSHPHQVSVLITMIFCFGWRGRCVIDSLILELHLSIWADDGVETHFKFRIINQNLE